MKTSNGEQFGKMYAKRFLSSVLKEVEKFRSYGDSRDGFKWLVCVGGHHVRRVPFRYKGHFCTKTGEE